MHPRGVQKNRKTEKTEKTEKKLIEKTELKKKPIKSIRIVRKNPGSVLVFGFVMQEPVKPDRTEPVQKKHYK